jgi:hypothetical protein
MDELGSLQMDISMRTAASDAWRGCRIQRGWLSSQRQEEEERGRLSLVESAEAVAARIAGKEYFIDRLTLSV